MNPITPRGRALWIALIAASAVGTAFAQGPGGFGGPGDQGGPPPEVRAKMDAWRVWYDAHPNVREIETTIRSISYLEETPGAKLVKPQAKAVLAILNAWSKKPVMSDADAKRVNADLLALLSKSQLTALATQPDTGRGFGGFGGRRGGGGPGGPGGAGGRQGGNGGRSFDAASIPSPREINPLNPATIPMERQRERFGERLSKLVSELKATK